MSDLRKAAEQMLECLLYHYNAGNSNTITGVRLKLDEKAIREARAALAAPRPEPVAWVYVNSEGECEQIEYGTEAIDDDSITLLYAAPPTAAPSEDIEVLRRDAERLKAENERLREALDKSLTDEQIKQIAAMIDRAMPLESAKILFARAIEAALKEVQR